MSETKLSIPTKPLWYSKRTITFWKHKQLTADCSLDFISSMCTRCLTNGNIGSCKANTLTTIIPSWDLARATLKNLVLPKLWNKTENNVQKIINISIMEIELPCIKLQLRVICQIVFDWKYFRGRYTHQLVAHLCKFINAVLIAIIAKNRFNKNAIAMALKL